MSGEALEGPYDPKTDPSLSSNGISKLIVPYLREELGFKEDAFYAGPFGGRWPAATTFRGDWLSVRWDWTALDRSAPLVRALRKNPTLRVFVASGIYDLATPYLASDYTFSHLGLDPDLRDNVVQVRYLGGHAVYLDKQVRPQLKRDVAAFVQKALK
jgi:hypothetical protein